MNNMVFCDIMKMDYKKAVVTLDSIKDITDNQIELLVANVQYMRLCQRRSRNKEFYDHHEEAVRRLKRIEEERGTLSERMRRRLVYASSEFHIVTSTYYYYVGLEKPSIQAIREINPDDELRQDTAQLLNYYYNVGAGGIITEGTAEEISQREFDYLMQCYLLARNHHFPYWEANSMQAMSEHLQAKDDRTRLIRDNLPAMKFLNTDNMPDSLLPGNLALRSLDMFNAFGDVYQTAGSYRTLASCYWQIKDYNSAIVCLNDALEKNKAINQAPDLVASIREQLSIVSSALNDKRSSDYNRNIYLDLQEQTRQDRYFESRADQLTRSLSQLNAMIVLVVVMIVVLILLLITFHRLRLRNDRKNSLQNLLDPLEQWKKKNDEYMSSLDDRYEDINEAYTLNVIHIVNNKKRALEQRAKISLVNSITPFIDRMLNEIKRLETGNESEEVRRERYTYIAELTDKINDYNTVLTDWIQMRQGELSLHIESFPVQQLFDIVAKSKMSFQLKGIELVVEPSSDYVKADRILTLFMINTIADNARKFTPEGGRITISSVSKDNYVEISVADTGRGISESDLAGIFDRKVYNGHGFGLMNCRGIIDKYKKISQIFNVCMLSAESRVGEGSRFFFRLPKGLVKMLAALLMLIPSTVAMAQANDTFLTRADEYADSAYYSNIDGTYERTLDYADSCRFYLNMFYLKIDPKGRDLMVKLGDASAEPAEIKWFRDSLNTDFQVIMDMRNESAVAALALHRWDVYRYNNRVYTQLFKVSSADNTLGEYCRTMQRSETNKNVAIAILVILLLLIFPAYYFLYYRHRVFYRFCVERVQQINKILLSDSRAEEKLGRITPMTSDRFPPSLQNIVMQIRDTLRSSVERSKESHTNIELAEDEKRRAEYEDSKLHICNSVLDNCLSTLKHETMYYPSRIRQLIDGTDKNLQSIAELAQYYKELYTILSSQAMRQIENMKQECRPFPVSDVLPTAVGDDGNVFLLGDKDLVKYLFDILRKETGQNALDVSIDSHDSKYVVFGVSIPTMQLDSEQCLQLFAPEKDRQPFLLCRQIARDNGESTNRRGCGITAHPADSGIVIQITLAKSNKTK